MCNSYHIQTTFFYTGRFLKKVAHNQCSSITEGRIYHIKHTTFYHGSGLIWNLIFYGSIYNVWYFVYTLYNRHYIMKLSYCFQFSNQDGMRNWDFSIFFFSSLLLYKTNDTMWDYHFFQNTIKMKCVQKYIKINQNVITPFFNILKQS